MYGPPQSCKRKTKKWQMVCANVFGLEWSQGLRTLMDIRSLSSYKLDGLEWTFTDIRFRERGRDPLPSCLPPADLAGTVFLVNPSGLRWIRPERERDSFRSCTRPPKRSEPFYWLRPPRPRSGACTPAIALTKGSDRAPVCLAVAARCGRLGRTVFANICCRVY